MDRPFTMTTAFLDGREGDGVSGLLQKQIAALFTRRSSYADGATSAHARDEVKLDLQPERLSKINFIERINTDPVNKF